MSKREIVKVSTEEQLRQQIYINEVRQINDEFYYEKGNKKKAMIITYGCQMNEHDSEKLAGMLNNMGYTETNEQEEADLIIYNTCCVRENAELKVYGNLGQLKPLKKERPDMIIAVCGCMMQQAHVVDQIKKKYNHVDLVFGTHNLHNFPELLANCKKSDHMIVEVWDEEGTVVEGIPVVRKYGLKAFVNIMYGCNNFCTYCIVPYTRGRERSRNPEDIVEEIKQLVAQGTKEVTLLGQNVNSYGKTLENKIDFSDLLIQINETEGLERIRFMTSHPKDLSPRLIEAMRDCDKICEHIHLPVQSGSTKILKEMNRHYTKEQYLDLVTQLKASIPNIAITTDIIVGFPGETEEDFLETLDLVKQVEYDSAFTFLYSVREGTPAAKLTEQVPEDVKHERFNRLLNTLNEIIARKNMDYKDAVVEVLVEGESKNDASKLMGRTRSSKLVNLSGSKDLIGQLAQVKITEARTFSLNGIAIDHTL
ncbi:tRNA (N6-isopentenyl adenosine(37)-C2)-methylthiotransferase MiaB [Geosporobacter ferrireducens]|uniref:tRNA-2-methylthio-N(6)-dimethylallyladenosine synthase n=1 Tax=Geosporobacter ferrireducens TaxID=1424294 RepID=A0A1D8GPT5_9FIRM|nr:tRNA (N6-isopentenyl adenosine(37)-C2)-methylthiotransferase MiaB [Geosporobacter ferrireducens]AOT72925.1 tRNA (N6-isopentenyl adenosine(37)-C2)-methylthiotransferase MiaB [Geosporobacter ferrireducens]AOT73338.1 tRNA (N6-isopentenyl adenosine(37)-C2)-methylthiotransferase MiaB [Geosporobacter ferrireducens]MTI55333.1 tRNA (N6-isopentenyl adenosine(37)-C2)-methylthiotransferase MiaB [Geosporobacter ferrireducens]